MSDLDVCLVSMPYSAVERPSIGLSLLHSALAAEGIGTRVLYANLVFAEQVGLGLHDFLCDQGPSKLLGEWTFAAAAFPEMADDPGDVEALAASVDPSDSMSQRFGAPLVEVVHRLREFAPTFVDQMARTILAAGPKIVGCTSMFQQHCAALALLRRIRELDESVVTLIGGANCEGEMGRVVARSFPWVDVVVSGEADLLIAPLCRQLLDEGRDFDPQTLPSGAMTAHTPATGPAPRAKVNDMDRVPVPNFDDYFLALAASPLRSSIRPVLLMETSRGCWWGEQQHCTFCGLNGTGMGHRAKSPQRALDEADALAGRYGIQRFEMVDNILDMSYLGSVLPTLRDRGAPYSMFYETKANLQRQHVELLVASGVDTIQPGIENLHAEALLAVAKGCTPMHNLQLLKWSREMGMRLAWSILVGIPGEDDSWWAETAEWLPLVEHFEPPSGVWPIHFQRFSPYHFDASSFGLQLRPAAVYRHLFPLPEEGLADLAYYFEDEAKVVASDGPGRQALRAAVQRWREPWFGGVGAPASASPPRLEIAESFEGVSRVLDTRRCATAAEHELSGLDAEVLRACDRGRSPNSLLKSLARRDDSIDMAALEASLRRLTDRRLILVLDDRIFALPVVASRPRNQGLAPSAAETSVPIQSATI